MSTRNVAHVNAVTTTQTRDQIIIHVSMNLHVNHTLSQKKDITQPPTIISTSCPIPVILVQILLSKYAIERWFNIPPHLFIVRILPWETLRS